MCWSENINGGTQKIDNEIILKSFAKLMRRNFNEKQKMTIKLMITIHRFKFESILKYVCENEISG